VQVTLDDVGAPRTREVVRAALGAQLGFSAAAVRVGLGWVVSGGGG
jgi:hypothetical protein